jgi:hypothetical protein
MLPDIGLLSQLLLADDSAGEGLPWQAIEEDWGTEFPGDYKKFIETYGAGSFGGYLNVVAPFPEVHAAYNAGLRMFPLDSGMLEELESPFPAYPALGGIIAVGDTRDGDTLLFKTAPRPEEWHIVTWSRNRLTPPLRWTEYNLGFSEFMIALLNAQLSENPFGARDLWGAEHINYLHWSAVRY